MGRAKSVIILIVFLVSAAVRGFCREETLLEDIYQTDSRLEKLQIYFETGMDEEAATLLVQLMADFPEEPRFEYLKAIVDYQRQDYQLAQAVFTKFISQYPDAVEPYYLLAEINLKRGNQEQAQQYLAKYCQLVPDDFAAQRKLAALTQKDTPTFAVIMENGREDDQLVAEIGFYGACLYAYEEESLKLINGSHCNWSAVGIDFVYPIDLRGKNILLKLKGRQGGERVQVRLRDQWATQNNPQLVLADDEGVVADWRDIVFAPQTQPGKIDLAHIVHLDLEFGSSTTRNPVHSTLFVKDIIISDVSD